jgi:hypothetical protein
METRYSFKDTEFAHEPSQSMAIRRRVRLNVLSKVLQLMIPHVPVSPLRHREHGEEFLFVPPDGGTNKNILSSGNVVNKLLLVLNPHRVFPSIGISR